MYLYHIYVCNVCGRCVMYGYIYGMYYIWYVLCMVHMIFFEKWN